MDKLVAAGYLLMCGLLHGELVIGCGWGTEGEQWERRTGGGCARWWWAEGLEDLGSVLATFPESGQSDLRLRP